MNRAIRLFLVLLAGLFGGLAIYASTGHFAEPAGEFGATIWIIACFGFAGYLTHRILPAADTADTYAAKRFFTKINEPSLTQNDDDLPVGPWYLSDFDDEERRQPANKVRIAIGTTCPGLRFREEEFPEHTVFFLPPRRGADYQFTLEVSHFPMVKAYVLGDQGPRTSENHVIGIKDIGTLWSWPFDHDAYNDMHRQEFAAAVVHDLIEFVEDVLKHETRIVINSGRFSQTAQCQLLTREGWVALPRFSQYRKSEVIEPRDYDRIYRSPPVCASAR